jgi:hypothetical protein
VKCVNAAVGRSSDHIKVPTIDPHQSTNFGALRLAEQSRGEPVSQIRIDDLGLDKCDLIKIDVEGMDLDVLNGAHGVISELKPIIFVENDEVEKSSALIDKLFSLKYQCWWHISPYYNPKNFLNNDTNVFDSYIPSINMLCIHEDFKSQVELPPVKNRNENWRDVVKRLQSSA